MRTGFEQFYSRYPELCGACSISDFNFENGDFKSSLTDYSSHWWTEEELSFILRDNYPGDQNELDIRFEFMGVGIFAICSIKKTGSA